MLLELITTTNFIGIDKQIKTLNFHSLLTRQKTKETEKTFCLFIFLKALGK